MVPPSFDQGRAALSRVGPYELPGGQGRKLSRALDLGLWGWDSADLYSHAVCRDIVSGSAATVEDGVAPNCGVRSKSEISQGASLRRTGSDGRSQQALFKNKIFHRANPAAIRSRPETSNGDVGRNIIRQPYFMRGYIHSPRFSITERQNFQFRMEIFKCLSLVACEHQWRTQWRRRIRATSSHATSLAGPD